MEIRKALVSDAPSVVTCVVEAFRDYMPLIGQTPGPMLEDYYEAILRHHTFVAIADGSFAGVIVLKDEPGSDRMWLDVLAASPAHKGQGVGRALIAHSEDYMRTLGKTECRLYTHVKYERTASIYRRLGYETYARVQEQGFDRYYMKKAL